MNTKRLLVLTGLVLVALLLAGCGGGGTAEPVAVAPTAAPPTETAIPPTDIPPTDTPVPPTATSVPPTETPLPPTETPLPPTDTPEPTATIELVADPARFQPYPSPRTYVSMVYDSESDRIVLIGGQLGDLTLNPDAYSGATWIYDVASNKWTQMDPPAAIGRRGANGLAYDAESDRVILFGGCNTWPSVLHDTWAYDTNTNAWTQMADGPETHLGPRLTYDSESDRVILFGGFTYPGLIARDDTWAYDFNSDTWTAMNPDIRPNGRNYQGLTYDVESDRVILWGGSDTYGEFDNSVWAYDYNSDSWEELIPGEGPWPRAREYAALTYDAESDRVILFGGITDRVDDRDETWAYDYNTNTWALMGPSANPGSLSKVALAYSDASDRVILFGGFQSFPKKEYSDATWAFDYNSDTWENVTPQE